MWSWVKLKNILFRTVEVVRDAGQTGQTKRLKDVPAFEEPENGQNDDTHSLLWTRCISSEVMRFGFSDRKSPVKGNIFPWQPCWGHLFSFVALMDLLIFISKCCLFSVWCSQRITWLWATLFDTVVPKNFTALHLTVLILDEVHHLLLAFTFPLWCLAFLHFILWLIPFRQLWVKSFLPHSALYFLKYRHCSNRLWGSKFCRLKRTQNKSFVLESL